MNLIGIEYYYKSNHKLLVHVYSLLANQQKYCLPLYRSNRTHKNGLAQDKIMYPKVNLEFHILLKSCHVQEYKFELLHYIEPLNRLVARTHE